MGRRTCYDQGLPVFLVMVMAAESKGSVWMDLTLCLCLVLVELGFKREELLGLHPQHQQRDKEKDGEESDSKTGWKV